MCVSIACYAFTPFTEDCMTPNVYLKLILSLLLMSGFVACVPELNEAIEPTLEPVPAVEPVADPQPVPSADQVAVRGAVVEAPMVTSEASRFRTLTDATGRLIEARLVAANAQQLKIQRQDGQFFILSRDSLSLADRELLVSISNLPHLDVDGNACFDAMDFGLKADGVSDDGPAIRAMLELAATIEDPVVLRFPKDKVIAVNTGTERYVFHLHRKRQLTIDGNGCEFRLDPDLRFIDVFDCEQVTVKNLQVDYALQATTPGTVMALDEAAHTIDVQLDQLDYAARLGGPTKEDGEQAFFGMLLLDAPYDTKKVKHFYVFGAEDLGEGLVRIQSDAAHVKGLRKSLKLGETRIGLPVPGLAHRHGPGALCRIDYSEDILFQNVEIWTAPWFSFQLFRNQGAVTMQQVHVRPRPGSGKVLSSCRDAIHAKGNRGELLFEDCILSGLGDDAFNISTHCSRIRKIHTPVEIEIRQAFPIQYIPFQVGDTLVVMNGDNNEIVGECRIVAIDETAVKTADRDSASYDTQFTGNAPVVRLRLDAPIEGMQVGQVAFDRQTSNPRNIIRGCRMDRSSRFQANVDLENCRIEAFTWLYGDPLEGPGPETVSIRNCDVRAQMTFSGWGGSKVPNDYKPRADSAMLKQVTLQDNELWGPVTIKKALQVDLSGNRFPSEAGKQLTVHSSGMVNGL